MIWAGFGVIAIFIALFIWDLAGQPTGRRWYRRRRGYTRKRRNET